MTRIRIWLIVAVPLALLLTGAIVTPAGRHVADSVFAPPRPRLSFSPRPRLIPTITVAPVPCATSEVAGAPAWTCVLGPDQEVFFNLGNGAPYVRDGTGTGDVVFEPEDPDAYLTYDHHVRVDGITASACRAADGATRHYDTAHRPDLAPGAVACRIEDGSMASFVQVVDPSKLTASVPELTIKVFFRHLG